MERKNFVVAKFVVVTVMIGLFSPTISIQEIETPDKLATVETINIDQGLIERLTRSEITFTLLNQAEARKKKKYKKARRKARKKARRRANYRHHRYHDRRSNTGAVISAAVVGAVLGAAINEANQD